MPQYLTNNSEVEEISNSEFKKQMTRTINDIKEGCLRAE
jgi:hypothetical protein